jgi:hypothetical protein
VEAPDHRHTGRAAAATLRNGPQGTQIRTSLILALGEFSTEIMTLLHKNKLSDDDEKELRETLEA